MIVAIDNFDETIERLSVSGHYGLDTETTGLRLKDTIFSVILADERQGYYFNFNTNDDIPEEFRLPREWITRLAPIVENPESRFFIHNAKFDMAMLSKDELEILGEIHCTQAMERVLYNNLMGHKPYTLAACAIRRGLKKDERVEEYIKKNKLITKVKVPNKDKAEELWHFDRVPWNLISEYGENDAVLHRAIGLDQIEKLKQVDAQAPSQAPRIMVLVGNEYKLTKACYRMERAGIHVNRPYIEGALSYTLDAAAKAKQSFEALTQIPYSDSAIIFKKAFEKLGIELPLTKTGKPCTNKAVLDELENPVADIIREIRGHEKLCSTYYSSFLHFADENDLIHANMRQGGTETSRFSYSDPNLQNLPKEDEDEDRSKPFLVRRSFTPLNSDWCFVPIDFKQQEFRMMLDYAGEKQMIAAIMAGADVHDATAEMVGTTRKKAKTLNFGLLYGMGAPKLAKALKISLQEAYELRGEYFAKLPNVRLFIQGVMSKGQKRGYIWNWFGFRNHISDPEYAYILPNHLIQGGCAQVIRVAMVQLDAYIREKRLRTQMLAQVHDELLFQVHRTELHHVPVFQKIMEDVYQPRNGLYLHCSVEHSWNSWGKFDQIKGPPDGKETGNAVQGAHSSAS